jgi:hypothetical protein
VLRCYKHIDLNFDDWCWKCQQIIDTNRINNSVLSESQINKITNEDVIEE